MKCEHGGTEVVVKAATKPDLVIGCVHLVEGGAIHAITRERFVGNAVAKECMDIAVSAARRLNDIGQWPPEEN